MYDTFMDDSFKQSYSLDKGRKLKVHIAFKRRPGGLLNVFCTFNLRYLASGNIETVELEEY